ncbi:small acid-soluble spore protein Tlp [Pseudalkalibacillus caeni]|uniref:Small acid-soluble spore protein Tlp n=1 Tax=Exobacillus caeni TaxID=2574798 RepID=A0A5R9F7F2_9BACL|nr:small acid-soluble spore protein Tlp [Pseudalkalibacillus caeni]TLS36763.1 small acid-soluble spore protein Tlp [Pseudalkalibacillus caeni]
MTSQNNNNEKVEKLQHIIENTVENKREAEQSLQFTDSEVQHQQVEAKNDRREDSLQELRSEVKDEANNHDKL